MSRRVMMTITGPSCSGKTTLLENLIESHPRVFSKVCSDTTRPPRAGEVDGDEYCYISQEVFIERHRMDLYAQSVNFKGVYYGTLKSHMNDIFEEGKCPIRVVEPGGVAQFREVCFAQGADLVSIYVDEDEGIMFKRWLERVVSVHNPDLEYYALRMLNTLDEQEWIDEAAYDFYYDRRLGREDDMRHALSRIALGTMSLGTIRAIAPRAA